MNDVVAVVLDFRTPDKTLNCLRSLAAEGITRVVMVENSEDGGATLRAMRSGLEALRDAGTSIDVLDEGRNLGFAAGVNHALRHILAAGKFEVLLLNSDARMAPGCLSALRSALQVGADLAAPMLVSSDGKLKRPVSYYQVQAGLITQQKLPGSLAFTTGACMLLSENIVAHDLFDEDFFFYGEDVALSAELHSRRKHCVVVDDASVSHDGSGSARNGSLFYEYHINRGRLLLVKKLPPCFACLPLALFFLFLRALVRGVKLRSAIPMRGLGMAITDHCRGRIARVLPPGRDG